MGSVPRHIAVILDGNRRFAKQLGLPVFKGHEKGMEKIGELLDWCFEFAIKELTLYCFSTENFKRDKKELDFLFSIFKKEIGKFKEDKKIHDNKVRVSVIGKLSMFSEDMQKDMHDIMDMTKEYGEYTLNLAMAYGSRSEIVGACKAILEKGYTKDEITEAVVQEHLLLREDVDLLIRPGGEKRISNFLLWQMAYGEIVYLDKMWPEVTKEDFLGCLVEYADRERRYGK